MCIACIYRFIYEKWCIKLLLNMFSTYILQNCILYKFTLYIIIIIIKNRDLFQGMRV